MVKEFSMTDWEIKENIRLILENKNPKPLIKKRFNLLYEKNKYNKEINETNDVFIYETIVYPPNSKPPTKNSSN